MTANDVLLDLLAHLRSTNCPILIDWDTTQQWPNDALDKFLYIGFLTPASVAQSIECHGCENHCFMDVITQTNNDPKHTRAFIVCDDPDMQSQIGRVQIPLVRLQQWQASVKQLSKVIADLLGFKDKIVFIPDQSVIRLGMLKSRSGRRWVTLNTSDLSLEINQHALPIDDLLYFDDKLLSIDQECIDDLLNRESLNQSKKYTPSTAKREAKKLETQAMYQDWNDEYLRLKERHRNKSKTWCSIQISKMAIGKDRNAETIRRNLKN